jgi:hypothetical protein
MQDAICAGVSAKLTPGRFEHVCTAAEAGHFAVAMFRHMSTGRCGNKGGCGRNIK